jgi:hypothetical protein
MQKFDYFVLNVGNSNPYFEEPDELENPDLDDIQSILKSFGTDGWELVNLLPMTTRGTTTGVAYYFKKPIE